MNLIIALLLIAGVYFGFLDPMVGAGLAFFTGAVTHPTAVRDSVCNHVVDQLDEGTPPGTLVFQTSGDVEVATLTFSTTAFGASSGGTATAAAITSDTSATGGTIAKARLKNAAGTDKIICSVTATGGGGDIELSSVVVSAGQTVSISSLTYSAMP